MSALGLDKTAHAAYPGADGDQHKERGVVARARMRRFNQ